MTRIAILCNDRVALPALGALLETGRVVAVAMPDHFQEARPVVQQLCAQAGISCCFLTKKYLEQQLTNWLHDHQPGVVLVKTFPWKIPASVLTIPLHGFINFHYAPLPAWRGPAPLFWMIRDRVPMAGITVHKMEVEFDTGPVILQCPLPLLPEFTHGILYTQLAYAGVQVTGQLLQQLEAGTVQAIPQQHSQARWHCRPVAADLVVHWDRQTAPEVHALVKACNPWNKGAATSWNGWTFGITDTSLLPAAITATVPPGTIVELDPVKGCLVACKQGQLIKVEVMYSEEGFFPGHQLAVFGIKKNDRLCAVAGAPVKVTTEQEGTATITN